MNCESKKYRRIVVKIGSNVLTREDGRPDTTRISALVDQLARLHRAGTEFILVSSGAVASGRSLLETRVGRIDTVSARQLFSAVGQVKLLNRYYDLFNEYGITCGQVLTTKEENGVQVADRVHVTLLSTDTTKSPIERMVQQSNKNGLYSALEIGTIWLDKALAKKA